MWFFLNIIVELGIRINPRIADLGHLQNRVQSNAAMIAYMLIAVCKEPSAPILVSWWRHQMEHFPRHWPFVRGIHRSPVNSPQKGHWRWTLIFPLICVWINGWVNNGEAGDLRRHRAHYDVTVMRRLHFTNIALHIHSQIKVRELANNFIPHFSGHVLTYPCWDRNWSV